MKNDPTYVPLQVSATWGATVWLNDAARPDYMPYNTITLYGTPGSKASCFASPNAQINGSGNSWAKDEPVMVTLGTANGDQKGGWGYCSLRCKDSQSESDRSFAPTAGVTAVDGGSPVQASSPFTQNYFNPGDNFVAIVGYSIISAAPNDGITPCTIYIFINPSSTQVTKVNVTLKGTQTAQLTNFNSSNGSTYTYLVNQNLAQITITDTVAESVSLTISVPEASGEVLNFMNGGANTISPPYFVQFPIL